VRGPTVRFEFPNCEPECDAGGSRGCEQNQAGEKAGDAHTPSMALAIDHGSSPRANTVQTVVESSGDDEDSGATGDDRQESSLVLNAATGVADVLGSCRLRGGGRLCNRIAGRQ